VGAAGGQAPPRPAQPVPPQPVQPMSPAYAPAGPPVPPRRSTSPIVWILGIVGGLIVLVIICVVGFTFFVVHKVKEAGLDPELIQKNPGLAIGKMVTAVNPDVEVIKTDDAAGTLTIRDKKTGKVVTVTFDQAKNGQFHMSAQGDDGTANIDIGGGAAKLPSWLPAYPGSTPQGTFSIKGDGANGEGGTFAFTTKDPASKVLEFYQDKAKDLGMKVNLNSTTDQGGMMVASNDDDKRTLTVVVGGSSGETTVNVTYAQKR